MSWNLNWGWSYIGSDWIKKATINSVNGDNKCFQYAATVALNYEEIGKISQIISKLKPFINKCNCKEINYPFGKDDWIKFDKANPTITLNALHVKK